ncbi:MAG: hypothetical protein NT062_27665 [Proteobacteria bacterium]|nr:hypothetical protein [Pseudomonadota bacterium]
MPAAFASTGRTPVEVNTSRRYCLPAGNVIVHDPSLRTCAAETTALPDTARTASAPAVVLTRPVITCDETSSPLQPNPAAAHNVVRSSPRTRP